MTRNTEIASISKSAAEQCLIADLIRALKGVDESDMPDIHARASHLVMAARRRLDA